jgi:hypothetical protein
MNMKNMGTDGDYWVKDVWPRIEAAKYQGSSGITWRRESEASSRRVHTDESLRVAVALVLVFLTLVALPRLVSAQGFTWKSYAEAGAGLSLAGSAARPVLVTDAGFFIGNFEIGTSLVILPLEFGSPDLLVAGAVHYGTSIGVSFGDEGTLRPVAKLHLGGVARDRADETNHLDGRDAERYFSASLSLGLDVPLGDRWSLRPWFAWRLSPDAVDYEDRSLGGPDFGLAVRTTWLTTIR